MAAIALVDIGALDGAACELLGRLADAAEHMAIVRIAGKRAGVEHELAARCAAIIGHDRRLDAELVRRGCLALADALDLRRMERIELPAALALAVAT